MPSRRGRRLIAWNLGEPRSFADVVVSAEENCTDQTDAILAELANLSRQLEQHHAAAWLIERRRDELCAQLRSAGWQPPHPDKNRVDVSDR
jgi:hypothetical protein